MPTADCTTFAPIAVAALIDDLAAAVDLAREMAGDNDAWQRAINTAWNWLLQEETLLYCASTHALRVESASTPGQYYTANGDCQCRAYTHSAARVCWHRAAARLVRRALELRTDRAVAAHLADFEALKAELAADAADKGLSWYGEAEAHAGATMQHAELLDFAADWDRMAEANRAAALGARPAVARAAHPAALAA